jgi:chromosome segregation ATPase
MDEECKGRGKIPSKEVPKHEITSETFEAIEVEFKAVMDGLGDQTKLVPFKVEYEKLFRVLTKSFQHELHLTQKCTELSSEINKNATAVKEALQLSQKDQSAIALLKHDTEKAWASVEECKRKEQFMSHTVDRLQEETNQLSDQLKKEQTRTLRQEEDLDHALREKHKLSSQRDGHLNQIDQLEQSKTYLQKENVSLEAKLEELDYRSIEKSKKLEQQQRDFDSAKEQLEANESSKTALRAKFNQKTKDNLDLQESATLATKKLDQLKKELRDTQCKMDKQTSECEELSQQTQQLSGTLESQKDKMISICNDLKKTRDELKTSQAAHRSIASDKSQLQRKYDSEHRNAVQLQQTANDAKATVHTTEIEIQSVRQQLDKSNRKEDQTLRDMETINREKHLLTKKSQRCEQKAKETEEENRQGEQLIVSLEKELLSARENAISTQKKWNLLEKLCEKHSNDLFNERSATKCADDTVRLRDIALQDAKKEICKWETKSSDQINTCKQLRAERGKISRQLIAAQEGTKKYHNQVSTLSIEIMSLRRELTSKDELLVKERLGMKQEEAQKEQASGEVCRTRQHLNEQEDMIQKQDLEIRKLNSMLTRMDEELLEQKKEYDQIVNERDVLGAQLIRRNDEIALLQERLKVQDAALKQGEIQYQERIDDIRQLSIKLQGLKREICTQQETPNQEDHASRDLAKTEKELLGEKIKVKALSEELENPLNVHRWRKLGGTDPAAFELVQKIEILQKRLIKKTEQAMEKDTIIQEQEKEFESLKRQVDRKPDTAVVGKLSICENEVREKERQMRAMAGELNMNQTQVSDNKKEIDRLNNELYEMKHKYFEQKKKEAMMKENELKWLAEASRIDIDMGDVESTAMEGMPLTSHRRLTQKPLRYVGGGFRAITNLNHSSHCNDGRLVR